MLASEYTNVLVAVIMVTSFLYEFSNRFRLYLKFLLYYSMVMMCSVMAIPLIIWRPRDVRNTLLGAAELKATTSLPYGLLQGRAGQLLWPHPHADTSWPLIASFMLIATFPLRSLNLLLGLEWEVHGQEHITVDRAAIVVANHQSSLDFLGMVYMWPMFYKITAIAKKELFYAMPFGLTAWLCGTRFIDRRNPDRAKASMNAALAYVKEEKVKLWVFPEGTRSMSDEMLPFKKGAFHLAVEGQLPILPIVYSSYRGFLSHPLKIFNPGHVIVTCLPPISTKGMTKEDMPKLMEDVRAQMMEVYRKTSTQVRNFSDS
ncbi:1-acyl-sn-glycerol-3-phosphate acyltransferase alpha-like isoform X2 [Eriocheir sinensis]|uniref:1-acyl-sn-glycerol-3-phosphate acyltransferase alpha-like isoform X2 n=1 Tax=Eriocheir sinensis TaxID=95602 RepID=UPI0021C5E2A6|nr:1-acyl-sn-glycerol-3-phosphate acyltransferase alpha-like isoform X2 [Eriocheir sinensis]